MEEVEVLMEVVLMLEEEALGNCCRTRPCSQVRRAV